MHSPCSTCPKRYVFLLLHTNINAIKLHRDSDKRRQNKSKSGHEERVLATQLEGIHKYIFKNLKGTWHQMLACSRQLQGIFWVAKSLSSCPDFDLFPRRLSESQCMCIITFASYNSEVVKGRITRNLRPLRRISDLRKGQPSADTGGEVA